MGYRRPVIRRFAGAVPSGRICRLTVTAMLACTPNRPAMPQSLSAVVTLRSGEVITGTLPSNPAAFTATTPTGEAVTVTIESTPEWSSFRIACDIDWNPDKQVFVVRHFGWTGELARIWNTIVIVGPGGKRIAISGGQVKQARFEDKSPQPRKP